MGFFCQKWRKSGKFWKIGHHKAEIGQNRIWGDGGSKELKKRRTSLMDVPYTLNYLGK